MSNFGDNMRVMSTPSATMGSISAPTPRMGPPCYPDNFTGFTVEQQNEFAERLNGQLLLLDKIGDIQVPRLFPLLWLPVTRAREMQPEYDSRTDLVYLLSRFPPAPWHPIYEELKHRWERERQQQEQAAYWAHCQQAQMHEQQLATGHQQMPSPYAHPHEHEMGGPSSQSAQMPNQYSQARNLEEITAAVIRAARRRSRDETAMERVDSDVDKSGSNDVSGAPHAATGLEETSALSANFDPSLDDMLPEEYGRWSTVFVE
ncbi:hypothetical protein BKA58DRAFT_35929 [Alternaria rosae]|uniref:uncharacterized protein n=1 Tax=Alternaria rosae TaxID=1187941 RepID=UPI001E8D3464|nr:uncharacterized protein BKA58DRAFT_35929 [Alternaria rosae]KAH6883392.1 hypothetical protein BKA58DRAFT_35929 [Alternaria rosae]